MRTFVQMMASPHCVVHAIISGVCLCVCVFIGCIDSGIGQGRITKNVEGAPVDYAMLVKDTDAVAMVS